MRIDASHRPWAIGSAIALATAGAGYLIYVSLTPVPSGGTWAGIFYGATGFLMMLAATFLSIRKRYRTWRIGRAQHWMRAHLWLGSLSYPIILFHAAFQFGGSLTSIMMWIFTIVFITGLTGAAIQHFMPRMMTRSVPSETIYDQIGRVREQLIRESQEVIKRVEKMGEFAAAVNEDLETAERNRVKRNSDISEIKTIYGQVMLPYLGTAGKRKSVLAESGRAVGTFLQLRTVTDPRFHESISDLESICSEKRDLDRQDRMHRILHGWLLVHVPLSYALIIMAAVHAIVALRY